MEDVASPDSVDIPESIKGAFGEAEEKLADALMPEVQAPAVIEDDVFIGSDTQLVAPVTVGRGATIGAGSTVTKNAPAGALTISRSRQTSIEGWKRPRKGEDH